MLFVGVFCLGCIELLFIRMLCEGLLQHVDFWVSGFSCLGAWLGKFWFGCWVFGFVLVFFWVCVICTLTIWCDMALGISCNFGLFSACISGIGFKIFCWIVAL